MCVVCRSNPAQKSLVRAGRGWLSEVHCTFTTKRPQRVPRSGGLHESLSAGDLRSASQGAPRRSIAVAARCQVRGTVDMRNRPDATEPTLFEAQERLMPAGEYAPGVPAFILDVPETIPQLGYGSHQFFRYYGKFPSIVGREIISRFAPPTGGAVLDCYAGSGTTLVEAQIAGLASYGVDINPLAVLACKVKTGYFDVAVLRDMTEAVLREAVYAAAWRPSTSPSKLDKWFSVESQNELGRLRTVIDKLPRGPYADFLIVAYLAIVRRCSNAFDGEVRPHVNAKKKPRRPFEAFRDKAADMTKGLIQLDRLRPANVRSYANLADNRTSTTYDFVDDEKIDLLVAHPPYLNSFNYLQVFSLEFYWAEGMGAVWQDVTPGEIRAAEHKAWPATDVNLVTSYYEDFSATMKSASSKLSTGGIAAIVIGDATIRGKLEPVHRIMATGLAESGLEPVEMWFRTTHYGIGKYAYMSRADYHGAALKKDAIMFFRKP